MSIFTVDLSKKLRSTNSETAREQDLFVERMKNIVESASRLDEELLRRIGQGHIVEHYRSLVGIKNKIRSFEPDRVVHIDQIRKVCLDYNLRCLPLKTYRGEFPVEALSAVKEMETAIGKPLGNELIIAAPESSFVLQERPVDPLLFAPIGNDYYYLLHKWGKDLSIFRRLQGIAFSLPGLFVSLSSMLITTAVVVWASTTYIDSGEGTFVLSVFGVAFAQVWWLCKENIDDARETYRNTRMSVYRNGDF